MSVLAIIVETDDSEFIPSLFSFDRKRSPLVLHCHIFSIYEACCLVQLHCSHFYNPDAPRSI
jgi:hypothetical protein